MAWLRGALSERCTPYTPQRSQDKNRHHRRVAIAPHALKARQILAEPLHVHRIICPRQIVGALVDPLDSFGLDGAPAGPSPAGVAMFGFFIVTLGALVDRIAKPMIRHDLGGSIIWPKSVSTFCRQKPARPRFSHSSSGALVAG